MLSKKYYIALIASFFFIGSIKTQQVVGQQSAENDTISYQNIISCEKVKSEFLFAKIRSSIYEIYDSTSISLIGDSCAEIQVQMKVYNQLLGKMGHPAGLLSFIYKIEVKDEKFRCQVDNFYFKAMERDRYGRFQEVRTDPELVCEHNFKSNSFLFKKIKMQSETYANKLSEKLKLDAISRKSTEIEW